jgi:hypothetical protein
VNSPIQGKDEYRCLVRENITVFLGWVIHLFFLQAAAQAVPVDYERDVRPILTKHCFACHGALRQQSGLRLDAVQLIREGGDRGPSISPGNSEESILIAAIRETGDIERMPPADESAPLSEEQIAILENWIREGAEAADEPIPPDPGSHWAYQSPARVRVPDVSSPLWQRSPIDAFLYATHERKGLVAAPAASKEILLRRLYFDLVGLPPTRDELRAFLNDSSDDCYDRVVDRLLASPRYGERWGRHWMDVWRYTDWSGLDNKMRHSQKHIWRWRDWIVESLNHDKSYDRMILEMLAGDELDPGNADTVRATGFLARNWYLYNRNFWLDDIIEHTAKGFLGVTLNCARCHEHKYDPISHEDYYRFRAFFEPHDVRLDQVGREKDLEKDGLPRVYDADPQAVTYRFIRGEETRPDKDQPHEPAIPAVLGTVEGTIQSVPLPMQAWFPELCPDARKEAIAEADDAVQNANEALEQARRAIADAARNFGPAEEVTDARTVDNRLSAEDWDLAITKRELPAAEAKAIAAQEERNALQAVLDADLARYVDSNHSETALKDLSQAARRARNQAMIRRAEADLIVAQNALAAAKTAPDSDSEKAKAAVTAAQAGVATANQELKTLKSPPDSQEPITEIHAGKVYPSTSTGRRLALARWIADRNNPLTARVAVNHIWTRHFGAPLVDSMFDFGLRTKQPVNHELLDWLAVEFMEHSWSMKHLHRLIVTSSAYRMQSNSSDADSPNAKIDPDNLLLWRMNVRRMEAEVVRDTLIYLTGRLDSTLGGPDLPIAEGDEGTRRTIYYKYSRDHQIPFLRMFNPASVEECYLRQHGIAPQQALAMSNSRMALTSGRKLAALITEQTDSETSEEAAEAFIEAAFETVLGRRPLPAEQTVCAAALTDFTAAASSDSGSSTAARRRACENLVHILLNHNDFITVR